MGLRWTPAMAVGVEVIDAQHQELFARSEALVSAMNQGQGREHIATTLRFLEEYILAHFEGEERLMVKHDYPGYVAHKEEHADFIREFVALKRELVAKGPSAPLAMKLARCISGWLPRHITRTDVALAAFLRAQRPARALAR